VTAPASVAAAARRRGGPPLSLVAAVSTVLFLVSIPIGIALTDHVLPSPFAGTDSIVRYYEGNRTGVRVIAFLQLGSSLPLAVYAATATAYLRKRQIRVAGTFIALVGGVLSAGALGMSAVTRWVLGETPTDAVDLVRALHALSFVTGGPGSVAPLGLLVAGVAFPGSAFRILDRPTVVAGVVLAALAEVSMVSMLWDGAAFLLPIARFGSMAWLIWAGVAVDRWAGRPLSQPNG